MGINVAFAVSRFLHEGGRSIADDKRNRFLQMMQRVFPCFNIGKLHGVGLRGHSHIDDRMGQVDGALRHPDEMTGLIGSNGHFKGPGVSNPDILTGKANNAAGNV